MTGPEFESYTTYREYPSAEMRQRAADFYAEIRRRRTVREFSDRAVPRDILENALRRGHRTQRRQPAAMALRRGE